MQRAAVPLPSPEASAPGDTASGAPTPGAHPTAARAAGRGGLAIAFAKVSFILFGFAQQLILPRLVGVDGYGEVSRVLAIVGIINNVIVATSWQSVSRAVSSVPEDRADEAFGRTLRLHVLLAIVLSIVFALSASAIASAVSAPHIAAPLRLAGAIVLLYGIYAPLVGSLNGRRRFITQASLDIGYGALRTTAVCLGAVLFLRAGQSGVLGAIAGFVAAATIIVPIAASRSGLGKRGDAGPSIREHAAFLLPLAVSQTFLNLLLQTDFMMLSRLSGEAAARLGLGANAADELVAVYRSVQLFAFLSYQLMISVTFILFPMLARAHADGDRAAVRRYTMTGVRLSLILTGLICAPISGIAPHVLRFAFREDVFFLSGGASLRVLSLGMGAFAVVGVVSSALTSLRRERTAALLTAATVVLVALACQLSIPRAAFGPAMLLSSATATSAVLAAAAVVGGVLVHRAAGGFVAFATPLRVGAALAIAIAVGARLPWLGKLAVLGEALFVGVIYLGVLVALREVGKDDLATFRQAFGRRARPA